MKAIIDVCNFSKYNLEYRKINNKSTNFTLMQKLSLIKKEDIKLL